MVRIRGLDDAPRYAGARDPALQHQVRLRAPIAEGDGTHVPQADGEEDEVAHPADRVAPVVSALLPACPRLRLDGAAVEDDVLALLYRLVAVAEHDSADDSRDDQQARLAGLGLGLALALG